MKILPENSFLWIAGRSCFGILFWQGYCLIKNAAIKKKNCFVKKLDNNVLCCAQSAIMIEM